MSRISGRSRGSNFEAKNFRSFLDAAHGDRDAAGVLDLLGEVTFGAAKQLRGLVTVRHGQARIIHRVGPEFLAFLTAGDDGSVFGFIAFFYGFSNVRLLEVF